MFEVKVITNYFFFEGFWIAPVLDAVKNVFVAIFCKYREKSSRPVTVWRVKDGQVGANYVVLLAERPEMKGVKSGLFVQFSGYKSARNA